MLAYPARDAVATLIREGVREYAVIDSPSAGAYPGFADSRDPSAGQVTSRYYISNITNVAGVLRGEKPIIHEVGPFSYFYTNTKHNITWSPHGEEDVSYIEYQRYHPADAATEALQEVPLTTANVLLLAALANPALAVLLPLLPGALDPSFWFPQRSAREIIFGYTDSALLNQNFPGLQPNDTSLAEALFQHSPTRMATGKSDLGDAYEYLEWSGGDEMNCCANGPQGEAGAGTPCAPLWRTYEASAVGGSFGNAFHPAVRPDETLRLATYGFGILRHWPLVCAGVGAGPGPGALNEGSSLTSAIGGCDSYAAQGIQLLKFGLPSWVLGNASVSADEAAAYGIDGPSGLLDISPCEHGAPIVLSLPRFLHGSNSLRDALAGDAAEPPDSARHDSWLGVEPVTGQVLDFQFRVQINVRMGPVTVDGGAATFYAGMAPVVLPLGWGEQLSSVTAAQGDEFRSQIYTPLRVAAALHWGGIALAVAGWLGAALALAARMSGRCLRTSDGAGDEDTHGDALLEGAVWEDAAAAPAEAAVIQGIQ